MTSARNVPFVALALCLACTARVTPAPDESVHAAGGAPTADSASTAGLADSSTALLPPPAEPVPNPGWAESFDGITCTHPAVQAQCTDGWCEIPAGCFIMGSPETEAGRGATTELQAAVTLTRSFEMSQTEVTRQQWLELMPVDATADIDQLAACLDRCPVTNLSWFDALEYANRLSAANGLAPCYTLTGCTNTASVGRDCESFELTGAHPAACEGYRLPTEAEWEYACRAGTRTAYYNGPQQLTSVNIDPALDRVAWYEGTGQRTTHPVGQLNPNGWGLHDMLGNVFEWVFDVTSFPDGPGPYEDRVVTSVRDKSVEPTRVRRGGRATSQASLVRCAAMLYSPPETNEPGLGFRLVRTLP